MSSVGLSEVFTDDLGAIVWSILVLFLEGEVEGEETISTSSVGARLRCCSIIVTLL